MVFKPDLDSIKNSFQTGDYDKARNDLLQLYRKVTIQANNEPSIEDYRMWLDTRLELQHIIDHAANLGKSTDTPGVRQRKLARLQKILNERIKVI